MTLLTITFFGFLQYISLTMACALTRRQSWLIRAATIKCRGVSFREYRANYLRTSEMLVSRVTSGVATKADQSSCVSQKMMLQQGLLLSASPGTFYMMPQLTRVLEKLYRIIDQEMSGIGAEKLTLPCLAPQTLWKKCDRWNEMGSELLKVTDRNKIQHCLAPTHEEAVTSIVAAAGVWSYRHLPLKLYQIGRKFRDEMRPKHGLLRCREFEMKDLYTFDESEEKGYISYQQTCQAYDRIFQRLGLRFLRVEASSGAMGGSMSHEFQLVSDVGEDTVYRCHQCGRAVNDELLDDDKKLSCDRGDCPGVLETAKGIEVAHAFMLGTKYSEAFSAVCIDPLQRTVPMYMGCFGIGVTRLIAASLEVLSTDKHIRWPLLLAPHQICVIPQKSGFRSEDTDLLAAELCDSLSSVPRLHREVVLDDRTKWTIGKRYHAAMQAGYPHIICVGRGALEDPPRYEYRDVYNGEDSMLTKEELISKLSQLDVITL